MIIKKIKIPIYKGEFVIVVGDFKEIYKKYNLKGDPEQFDAIVWWSEDNGYISYYVAFRGANPKPDVVAHEAVHITSKVFRDRGISLDPYNDEPQAYFTGWVVEQCYKLFDKINASKVQETAPRCSDTQLCEAG